VLGLAAGSAVFLALSLLVGFLPADDAEWIAGALGDGAVRLPRSLTLALAGRRQ
jgi:hypothetical protein